jgi:hypothetical protein
MKQVKRTSDGMRTEYDFSNAVRGKYFDRFKQGSNIVKLDPDVFEVFPTSDEVNSALRLLASVARKRVPIAKRASRAKVRRSNKAMPLTGGGRKRTPARARRH